MKCAAARTTDDVAAAAAASTKAVGNSGAVWSTPYHWGSCVRECAPSSKGSEGERTASERDEGGKGGGGERHATDR